MYATSDDAFAVPVAVNETFMGATHLGNTSAAVG